jgi:hypothetical protein
LLSVLSRRYHHSLLSSCQIFCRPMLPKRFKGHEYI